MPSPSSHIRDRKRSAIKGRLLLSGLAGLAFCASAGAAPLCPAASQKWPDFVEDDPPHVLELDHTDCTNQVAETDRIIACTEDYTESKHPVYYHSVALSACVRQHPDAHYYAPLPGKPYPAHAATDLAHTGGS